MVLRIGKAGALVLWVRFLYPFTKLSPYKSSFSDTCLHDRLFRLPNRPPSGLAVHLRLRTGPYAAIPLLTFFS